MWKSKKKRRGTIAVVVVFGMVMAILMLGMMRVASTVYAHGVSTTKQYADINSMRGMCQVAAYQYMTDLMAVYAERDLTTAMPGTTDSVIYQDGIEALQNSLMNPIMEEYTRADGTIGTRPKTEIVMLPDGSTVERPMHTMRWKVEDASVAFSSLGELHPETQTKILSMVVGKEHRFSLDLMEDLVLNYHDATTYIGIDEVRVALKPFKLRVELRLKSETVVEELLVDKAYFYAQKDATNKVAMRITDDGMGSGVHIYRAT